MLNYNGKKVNRVIDANWAEFRPLGNVYPDFKGRVGKITGGGYVIINETGWDGHEEVPPAVMDSEGEFASAEEALGRIYELCELCE